MRAMFTHVPSAWLCMGLYAGLAVSSFVWFIWRHELADVAARAIAPIGAGYTALCFVTGSIWGQKGWGAGWHNLILGDSRLMSVLILFFLFLGYMALRAALETRQKAARAAAILAMVGFINIPIIKVSVDMWQTTTIHQPSSVISIGNPEPRADDAGMNPVYLQQLLWGFGGHSLLAAAMIMMLMRAEIYGQRADRLMAKVGRTQVMVDFGDDGIYVWSITALGIAAPILLGLFAFMRVRFAKKRLERMEETEH